MNVKTIKKIYLNTYFRISFKVALCFVAVKGCLDFFSYKAIGSQLKIPRFVTFSPTNLDEYLWRFKST
jgi:hypothetical protein